MTDKEKLLERWAEFYEELYADNPSTVNIDDSHEEEIPNFLKCEVETAINELKIGKKVLVLIKSIRSTRKQEVNRA